MVTYLDHAATTPVRPEVVEAMLPFLTTSFGNPSGGHLVARAARRAVEEARDEVAAVLGCSPREVVFTSGGTEADNLAIAGVAARSDGDVVCGATEHPAVLHAAAAVGGRTVAVGADGVVDLDALAGAVDEGTSVVSLMLANNEVGAIQPLDAAADVVAERAPGAVLHTDAVQGAAWLDVAAATRRAHLVSVSAHKLGGPQGVGALVVREGVAIEPLFRGGGQERERRSGTQHVAGIVGFATALRLAAGQREETAARVRALRDRLVDGLLAAVPRSAESGDRSTKVPGIASLLIDDIESEALLVLLDRDEICASAASSCASGAVEPSHVLAAMGVPRRLAAGSLRLSLGWTTTDAEVEHALECIPPAVAMLRERATGLALR